MQLLGINVCFKLLSKQKRRENESMGLQSYKHVRTGTTTRRIKLLRGKYLFSEWIVATSFYVYEYLSLSLSMTSPTVPHSSQGFSAGERTVTFFTRVRVLTDHFVSGRVALQYLCSLPEWCQRMINTASRPVCPNRRQNQVRQSHKTPMEAQGEEKL
jgi:hypothetical protein